MPDRERLHLHLRPPSPPTYQAPRVTLVGRICVIVGVVSALLLLCGVLAVVLFGLVAGEPG